MVSMEFSPFCGSELALYGELLAEGLSEAGNQVTVISSLREGTRAQEEVGDIQVLRVPIGVADWIGFSYGASRLLRRIGARSPFDIVHFLDLRVAYAYPDPYLASLFRSLRQRAIIERTLPHRTGRLNRMGRQLYYNLARRYFEKRTLERANYLIASSAASKDEFTHHYGVEEERVEVVYPGIDTNFFQVRPTEELRRSLGVAEGERIILHVGPLTPGKGLTYLARALWRVEGNFRLMLIDQWEGGYRERVWRQMGPQGEKVIEIGYVHREEIPHCYSLADVLVLPWLFEGFGFSIMEAMACGTPVVATEVGSIPEVMGDCGLLVPPRDHQVLAEAINRVFHDEALRQNLAKVGRTRVVEHFSRARMTQKTLEVYRRVNV